MATRAPSASRSSYKLLPLFTKFIAESEHRLGLLQLLQGDVYERKECQPVRGC